jgi:hypothetical protein
MSASEWLTSFLTPSYCSIPATERNITIYIVTYVLFTSSMFLEVKTPTCRRAGGGSCNLCLITFGKGETISILYHCSFFSCNDVLCFIKKVKWQLILLSIQNLVINICVIMAGHLDVTSCLVQLINISYLHFLFFCVSSSTVTLNKSYLVWLL